ncbi:transketolase C-terminal domain-containing protein [Candidatus Pelagibacter sp.]|nr:transketolase C-terminal domain-containing protein [Candidatus Pelagibacter sp.]
MLKSEKQNSIRETKSLATRKSSELTLDALTKENNTLIGGSADLAGSNNTKTKYHNIIKPGNFNGDYIHYGVREHAMCGIMNGIALHSKFIPYGGTFLIFTDYCKPSIRLSALMKQRVIYVMTHDSIGLGEDGPTHQPIEQLSGLRSIPNLNVFRPADRMETIECWELSLKNTKTPSVLSLTRQNLDPVRKKYSDVNKCSFGAYEILRTSKNIDITILASGSEVNLAIQTSHKLAKDKIYCKVISVPCQELFDLQPKSYKRKILGETEFKVSIEAASTDCWRKYVGTDGLAFGIDTFGKSAPYKLIYKHFGLTAENISKKIRNLIKS